MFLQKGFQLLNDIQGFHLGGKIPDELHGQGVRQAQLEEGSIRREGVSGVLVGDGRGNDAGLAAVQLHPVQRRGAAVLLQGGQRVLHLGVVHHGVGGGGYVLAGVAGVGGNRAFLPFTEAHQALGVGHPGGGAEEHRQVEPLGDLIGRLHEVQALLGVGGLHHGQLGGLGVVAVVLLILGGVHTGVVGGDDDKPAGDAVIGRGEDGVRRHVHPHVLHGAQGPDTGNAGSVGHLCGNFFIGGPLAVEGVLVLGQVLEDLRTGGAGVGRADLYPGFIRTPGNGLVARQ